MNIPNLPNNQVMTGILFFISMLPFIVLRLNGSIAASPSPATRNSRRTRRHLAFGTAICGMLILPPVTTASAEELFVIFTDSGPKVYQVDTVQDSGLTLNRHDSPLWPTAIPDLSLDRSLFVTLSVNNKPPVLLPGFQNTATSGFGTMLSKFDRQLTRVLGDFGTQVATSPLHKAAPEPTQSQQMVHQRNLEPHPSISN